LQRSEWRGTRRGVAGAALLSGLVALAAPADARSITVRWRYAAPARVAGFRLHLGPAPGQYTQTIDVGRVTADADGIYQASVEVADDEPTYLAVSAYGAGGEESPRSNETLRAPVAAAPSASAEMQIGTPGQPRVVDH